VLGTSPGGSAPKAIAFGSGKIIYVDDSGSAIREIGTTGANTHTTLATFTGAPTGVFVGASGAIYVAEGSNWSIWKLAPGATTATKVVSNLPALPGYLTGDGNC
jgi:hypothetical protein